MKTRVAIRLCCIILACAAFTCRNSGRDVLSDGRSVYRPADEAPKTERLEGTVFDSTSRKGIPGAVVELKNANLGVGYYRVTTDSNGRYGIAEFIKQVQYRVSVAAEGYVPYSAVSFMGATGYSVYLDREAVLEGRVRDSKGRPIEGVEIKLQGAGSPGWYGNGNTENVMTVTSGADGSYRAAGLREMSWSVTFSKPGYITETARLERLRKGEMFTLPMVMFRPASISGRVLIDEVRAPAPNIAISAKGRQTYSANTYQDGTYTLDDLKPGTYLISLSHPGFLDPASASISIAEGEMRGNADFTIRAKRPAVVVGAHRYTFTPGMNVSFNLRTLRVDGVNARIYRVPMEVFFRGRVNAMNLNPAAEGFRVVHEWKAAVQNFVPYEWRYQTLNVNKALPPGGYCVEVAGPGEVKDRKFFSVTSVGIVAKRSAGSVFAYVTDLVKNEPLNDVKVFVFDSTPSDERYRKLSTPYKEPKRVEKLPARPLMEGKTDANGIFHNRYASGKHMTLLAVGRDGSYALCSTGSPLAFEREMRTFFIYTDRPVYRAGNTVQYKIIGKQRERRCVPLAGREFAYRITNTSLGKVVQDGRVKLDEWGSASGKIELPGDANSGLYSIGVGDTVNDLSGAGTFHVEEYRKPEFMVDITPSRDYFINGDTAEFKVQAKYFFGSPLKGAVVKYRFFESRLRDRDTGYWWDGEGEERPSYNRVKLEGEKQVDENGIAILSLSAGSQPFDREITLEASVTDRSNVTISSKKSVKVGRGEYYIRIRPERNFFTDDEPAKLSIETTTHTGEAVARQVKVQVFRYIWRPLQMVYVHEPRPVFERNVATDARGKFDLTLPLLPSTGQFDIVATGTDRRNNEITGSRVVWFYRGDGGDAASRYKNLELSVDRTKLDGPGKVTCLVKSRFPDSHVCLTLEGRDVYESKVIKLKGHTGTARFDITPAHAPNLFVVASMQRDRALYTVKEGVTLPAEDTALAISIEPERETYLPGEKASVRLRVTDSKGAPVRADLSLACVDESIFQIRPDATPRMNDAFYARLSNWVLTAYSYPITLLAGAIKSMLMQLRERFEDTAFWRADIRTGSDGTASVSFTLPDNLTTWRLTARGHDREGRVGEAKKQIMVTQDLVARIGRPRFLTEGDTVGLIGIVNSNTKRDLAGVSTEFRADGKVISPDEPLKMSLPGFGSGRNFYTITVPEGKESLALEWRALADARAKDGLKITMPIRSRGTAYRMYGAGDMTGNRTVELAPLGDTGDFIYRPATLLISVSPGPVERLAGAAEYLRTYEYGCVEQTLSKLVPNLGFTRFLRKNGMEKLWRDEKLESKVQKGIADITSAQNDDGTWGWWSGDRGNEFITAYVLQNMKLLQEHGYRLDPDALATGINAADRIAAKRNLSADARACAAYAAALWGRWNEQAVYGIAGEKSPNPYRLAFVVRALSQGRRAMANDPAKRPRLEAMLAEKLNELKAMQKRDGSGIYWAATPQQRYGWQGGDTEISAHVLAALVEAGDASPLRGQLSDSLARRMRGDAWASTKETAAVMSALIAHMESAGRPAAKSGEARFSLNGKEVARIAYDQSKPAPAGSLRRAVDIRGMAADRLVLAAEGDSNPGLSFSAVVDGNLYFKDTGFFSFLKSEDRGIARLENGISLVRSYHTMLRVRDRYNAEYLVPQDLSGSPKIAVGDEILVKLRFRAQESFEYLVLEDYLPSGFEVVEKDAYKGNAAYSHCERRDDKMVYFFTRVPKNQVCEVAYLVRAELPGRFLARPARVECMYEPTIQGWSKAASFSVGKK